MQAHLWANFISLNRKTVELKDFNIPFEGLKLGLHHFSYKVDAAFYEHFDFDRCHRICIQAEVEFTKKERLFELHFEISGSVEVTCDVSLEDFSLPVSNSLDLVVKLGQSFNNDSEEVLILSSADHHINVAQYIYEAIVMAVPAKLVHPGVIDGSLESDILDHLEDLSPKELDDAKEDEDHEDSKAPKQTDPRWDKLKDLL